MSISRGFNSSFYPNISLSLKTVIETCQNISEEFTLNNCLKVERLHLYFRFPMYQTSSCRPVLPLSLFRSMTRKCLWNRHRCVYVRRFQRVHNPDVHGQSQDCTTLVVGVLTGPYKQTKFKTFLWFVRVWIKGCPFLTLTIVILWRVSFGVKSGMKTSFFHVKLCCYLLYRRNSGR